MPPRRRMTTLPRLPDEFRMPHDPPRPFRDHLGELRRRALVSAASLLAGVILSLPFAPSIFTVLAKPMREILPPGASLIALTPFEAWTVVFQIAAATGLVLSSPIWLSQLLAFARPAVGARPMRTLLAAGALAGVLFIAGVALCYAVLLPAALSWGMALSRAGGIELLPQVSAYASFALAMLLASGLACELPLIIALLLQLGIVRKEAARRARPFVIVAAFVVGAILTPPDIVSQILASVPLILLYELGLLLGRLPLCRRRREAPLVNV